MVNEMFSQGQSNAVFWVSTMMNLLLLSISLEKSEKVLHYLEVAMGLGLKYQTQMFVVVSESQARWPKRQYDNFRKEFPTPSCFLSWFIHSSLKADRHNKNNPGERKKQKRQEKKM